MQAVIAAGMYRGTILNRVTAQTFNECWYPALPAFFSGCVGEGWILQSIQNPLGLECLSGFDHQRFGVLARALQVLLAHGAIEYAVSSVRQFAAQTRSTPATQSSPLVEVVGVRLANAMEQVGCTTVGAFTRMADAEILSVPNVGEGAIAIRDRLRCELASGELASQDFEELEFDFLDWRYPHEVLKFSEVAMSLGSANISVMDALKVLSKRREEGTREIDSQIARLESEINSLKQMRKLLGGKNKKAKSLSSDLQKVASRMADALVGKAMKPGEIAGLLGSTAIQIGKIAANDARFKRNDDGRIVLA
jgi:hypothetical protein